MKIVAYEIIDHGWCNSQYFEGCGVSLTKYTDVWTGAGDSSKDAYNDALVQAYSDIGDAANALPIRPVGFALQPRVPWDADECYWYVSVRAKVV